MKKRTKLALTALMLSAMMILAGCSDGEGTTTQSGNNNNNGGSNGNTPNALTGAVTITGTAQVGETLTANTAALGGSGTISYQWKKSGTTNIGTNSVTYVVQAADAGSTITVTVTRSGNSGSVTSAGIQIPTAPASVDITVRNTAEWNAALETVKNGGNGTTAFPKPYTITVSGNVMVNGSAANSFGTVSNVTVTIKGNGRLYLLGQGSILNIANDQTVYIDSAGLTLQGLKAGQNDSSQDNNAAVVSVSGGTLELRNGTISGNSGGSGVRADRGSFTMSGGIISGNTSSVGGGVYITTTFTMTGGTINGNNCNYGKSFFYGGGVYSSGNFNMSGGTISNNLCGITPTPDGYGLSDIISGYGGGVYIGGGSFTMSGGTISNNSVRGGGYNYPSTLYTSSSSDNRREFVSGGGVYISNGGSFIKSGGGNIFGNNVPPANDLTLGSGYPNGKEVFFNSTPARYRDTELSTADDINTNTLTGWGQRSK